MHRRIPWWRLPPMSPPPSRNRVLSEPRPPSTLSLSLSLLLQYRNPCSRREKSTRSGPEPIQKRQHQNSTCSHGSKGEPQAEHVHMGSAMRCFSWGEATSGVGSGKITSSDVDLAARMRRNRRQRCLCTPRTELWCFSTDHASLVGSLLIFPRDNSRVMQGGLRG